MSLTCQLHETRHEGFAALHVSNGQIALTLVPRLGAKIVSIQHVPSHTEWLWTNPYLPYQNPIYGASYIREFDVGGLDECFPSVGPAFFPVTPWAGTPVPDHGELWSQPWDVKIVEASERRIALSASCYGVRLPYRFERTLIVETDRAAARLEYRAENLSPFELPFIWSIHPLFRIEPGMRLRMPAAVTRARVDFSTNDFLGKMGTLLHWPVAANALGQTLDLSQIQSPCLQQGVKLFTLPLQGDELIETGLTDTSGEHGFYFRFLPNEITHIGVWMNYAGWTPLDRPPYYNLALEPCIGASDSLTVAVNHWREHGILAPKQGRAWSLEIALT